MGKEPLREEVREAEAAAEGEEGEGEEKEKGQHRGRRMVISSPRTMHTTPTRAKAARNSPATINATQRPVRDVRGGKGRALSSRPK